MSRITICIPTYNSERYISEAIESVLQQEVQDFKLVIVDDNSSDTTLSIVESFCSVDARIYIRRHSENSGAMGLAIQEVMRECDTKYFMWFGSDDVLTREYVSRLLEILETSDADYVYSDFQVMDELGNPVEVWRYPLLELPIYIGRLLQTFSGSLPMNGVFKISKLREKNLDWILYKGESRSSDTINGLYFRINGLKFCRCEEPLFKYRVHTSNLSHELSSRLISDRNVIDFIFETFPELVSFIAMSRKMTILQLYMFVSSNCEMQIKRRLEFAPELWEGRGGFVGAKASKISYRSF